MPVFVVLLRAAVRWPAPTAAALRLLRSLVGLHDDFFNRHLIAAGCVRRAALRTTLMLFSFLLSN